MDIGDGIIGFDCGQDAVLYSTASGELFVLNDTAAVVFRALARGTAIADVCRGIAATTRTDVQQVERDVRQLVESWRQMASRPQTAEFADSPGVRAPGPVPFRAGGYRDRYRLAGFSFELCSADHDDHRAANSVLGHLRDSSPGDADTVLQLVRDGGRWLLLQDGAAIDECDTAAAVGPMIHASTLMLAYTTAQCFAAVHAGAVLRDGRCVLLPAGSGNGKSTLTAALVAAGYGYLSDDFAILTQPPIHVRAVPLGIGLKEGAWPVLAGRFPAISELPLHVRADGKRIRYLLLRQATVSDPVSVAALIFPQYRRAGGVACHSIRPAHALLRLATAGYDMRLSAGTVRSLVEWVGGIPSYELVYDSLEGAIAAIDEVTR
jgi:hypothetical protein